MTTTRLPNGTTLTRSCDNLGRLSSLTSNWLDSNHPATLASGFTYHASGAVARKFQTVPKVGP